MSNVEGWSEPEVMAEYLEEKEVHDTGASVPWELRAAYMTQTQTLVRALTRSLDAAQVGTHLDLELDELLEQHHKAVDAYTRAVEDAAGG